MLATPPFRASSNIALLRANIKPPIALVVAEFDGRRQVRIGSAHENIGGFAPEKGEEECEKYEGQGSVGEKNGRK